MSPADQPTDLKLSVLDLVPRPEGMSSAEAIAASIRLAQRAEQLGYYRYWIAEHHNTESFISGATALLIGEIARATRNMRVGSGGIMLPNHSPFHIAENFLTLEALHPGRIDLGLGRAPGTDQLTALALRRSRELIMADDFPEQVELLEAYAGARDWPDGHPLASLRATPSDVPLPPVWLLGSSTFSANLAARTGKGFAYAYHFSPANAASAMHLYRSGFEPSADMAAPHAILGVAVVCAETEEEADILAGAHDLMWIRIRQGHRSALPSDAAIRDYVFSDAEIPLAAQSRQLLVWGTPDTVAMRLKLLAHQYGADELMITSHIADPEARIRSYELVADAL